MLYINITANVVVIIGTRTGTGIRTSNKVLVAKSIVFCCM